MHLTLQSGDVNLSYHDLRLCFRDDELDGEWEPPKISE